MTDLFRVACLLLMGGLATGCVAPRTPYTLSEAARAEPDVAHVRTWGDYPDAAFERRTSRVIEQAGRSPTYLTLSGGGGDGAYGAGILNGWTQSGRRPEFTIVSGVSTGALIAPFAFLGPRYDATIKDLYTSGVAEEFLADPSLVSTLFGASVFSNDNLRQVVARYVTPDFVAEVARESERGRLLLVLTTNLDAQRPVLWDMGLIARGGDQRAVELFRDVMVASASVPVVFPPTLIGVQANGRAFQEMHVDGGISANVFTLPRNYLGASSTNRFSVRGGRMFILLNTSPLPDFEVTENRTTEITKRTISLTLAQQIRNDLRSTYDASTRTGFSFNLTYIRKEDVAGTSDPSGQSGFDTARMRRLYKIGFERGRTGNFWQTKPPSARDEIPSREARIAAR
ncbi:patatin-like phospholipase family protein [uncultured Enterovirga sp.]|uniref:patatin-like phospholipase family protein n=1 Tax=uncultured Enterovirga sp. TaxID=2026352 RepID=UPI0035CB1FD0